MFLLSNFSLYSDQGIPESTKRRWPAPPTGRGSSAALGFWLCGLSSPRRSGLS